MNQIKRLYAFGAKIVHFFAYPVTVLLLKNTQRVRVLICAEESILLQRTSVGSQKWNLPGGGVTKGETFEQSAVREVKEEVGLELTQQQLQKIGTAPKIFFKGRAQYFLIFFVVQLSKKEQTTITRPLEILEVAWFPVRALPEKRSETVDLALTMQKSQKTDK